VKVNSLLRRGENALLIRMKLSEEFKEKKNSLRSPANKSSPTAFKFPY